MVLSIAGVVELSLGWLVVLSEGVLRVESVATLGVMVELTVRGSGE